MHSLPALLESRFGSAVGFEPPWPGIRPRLAPREPTPAQSLRACVSRYLPHLSWLLCMILIFADVSVVVVVVSGLTPEIQAHAFPAVGRIESGTGM